MSFQSPVESLLKTLSFSLYTQYIIVKFDTEKCWEQYLN